MNILHFETNKKILLLLPPIAIIAWHVFYMANSSAFYNSRVDPDYAYLLNGLNCALGEFQRIGHVDHPGTPFQMLTGLFIIILHFFFGKGEIANDVISNPEKYLTGCLTLLIIIEALVSYWVSLRIYAVTKHLILSFLIGLSLLLYGSIIDFSNRYIPEHLLLLFVLLLAVPLFNYLFDPNYSSRKFVIFTGIIAGTAAVCKVTFLPLVIVPFIVVDKIKNKLLYASIFIVTAFLNFLPIISKHATFRNFIVGISKHDGLYGSGSTQFINIQNFLNNLFVFSHENIWFLIVFTMVLVLIVFALINNKQSFFQERINRFYFAFIIVSIVGLVMTLKHYKGYYFAPELSLTITAFAIIWFSFTKIFRHKKIVNFIFVLAIVIHLLFIVPGFIVSVVKSKSTIEERNYNDVALNKILKPGSYKIIELSWGQNLTVEYGIAFGLCYVANNDYYNECETVYSNTLSWEGSNKPLYSMKLVPVVTNSIFYSGKSVYFFDSPSVFPTEEINYFLQSESNKRNIDYSLDTVFYSKSSQVYVVEFKNLSSWKSTVSINLSFESTQDQLLLADDGITSLQDNGSKLVTNQKCTGQQSLILNKENSKSPGIPVNLYKVNDYILVSLKIKGALPQNISEIIKANNTSLSENRLVVIDSIIQGIKDNWSLVQVGISCQDSLNSKSYFTIQNITNSTWFVDDLKVEHFTNK